jgi:hypothetical protein
LSITTSPKFFPIKEKTYIFLDNQENSKKLIKWSENKLYLNVQKGILTKLKRNLLNFNLHQRGIIIGIILSDGWIQKREKSNPRIGFKQSIKNFKFF